jgi:hypothetical protein
MAQDGVGPAGQDSRQLACQWDQRRVPNRVDAAVEAVQPPRRQAMVDRAETEPQGRQLPARDDAVLSGRDLGDGSVASQPGPENAAHHVLAAPTCEISARSGANPPLAVQAVRWAGLSGARGDPGQDGVLHGVHATSLPPPAAHSLLIA